MVIKNPNAEKLNGITETSIKTAVEKSTNEEIKKVETVEGKVKSKSKIGSFFRGFGKVALIVASFLGIAAGLAGCSNAKDPGQTPTQPPQQEEETEQVTLNAPDISYANGIFAFKPVENAEGYNIQIKSGNNVVKTITLTGTDIQLSADGNIEIPLVMDNAGTYTMSAVATHGTQTSEAGEMQGVVTSQNIGGLNYNTQTGVVTFNEVPGATQYKVAIDGQTYTVETNSIDLSSLNITEGSHSFKVSTSMPGVVHQNATTIQYQTPSQETVKTPLAQVQNIEVTSATRTLSYGAVANATSYNVTVTNAQGQVVFNQTTAETSVVLSGDYAVGGYNVSVVAQNLGSSEYKNSEAATSTFAVSQVQSPSVSRAGNVVSITTYGTGAVTATLNGNTVQLTKTGNNTYTYQITNNNGGILEVTQAGDGGFVKDSAAASISTNLQTTQLAQVQNLEIDSATKTLTFGAVANATSYDVVVTNAQGQEVFRTTTSNTSVVLGGTYSVGMYDCAVTANSTNVEYTSSTAATRAISVARAQKPTVTFENNVYTVTATGEVVATFNGQEVTLTNGTYTITEDGTLSVTQKGNGGFVLDSEATSLSATYEQVQETVTYADVVEALETKLTPVIQNSYKLGTVSNVQVKNINAKDGTVYCTYNLGSTERYASIQVEGLESATSYQNIIDNVNSYTYGTVEGKVTLQSNEDALALVEAGMHWGVDSLDGYTMDDVSWATATTFSSASATNITVVFEDGTMVEYTLSVSGATASSTAKNDYINGCAHNILNETETEYQSLQDKLETQTQSQSQGYSARVRTQDDGMGM